MIKKVVFFGRRFEANKWANKNKVNYRNVILGTSPDEVRALEYYPTVIIDETWKPTEEDKAKAVLSLDILALLKIIFEEGEQAA